ncbi:uncharacterized protein PADG_11802 [Paracoccidioides brasiliensis Pb18]|uniref:Uncharacterized protein n=1 Tax=Paracoccidioides brasiliensis (strain Pb18) TaxID=502780 RepID=A0A0A0HX67_PARBD|nr:uncharacterized protein PADG_11802 [Paracoccidioides brasiliensis Pb18]KGM92015.1 hypothetical protein PADG_11802 [Paracoccidioides brasiliensis Pb18]
MRVLPKRVGGSARRGSGDDRILLYLGSTGVNTSNLAQLLLQEINVSLSLQDDCSSKCDAGAECGELASLTYTISIIIRIACKGIAKGHFAAPLILDVLKTLMCDADSCGGSDCGCEDESGLPQGDTITRHSCQDMEKTVTPPKHQTIK